jgi:hypothetical protein
MRRGSRSRNVNPRRGIVAVMVAVSLFILVGALAFAIDGGYMFEKKHVVSGAAEAAATAAANLLFENDDLWNGQDPEHKARNLALEYAAGNGFAHGDRNQVTVNIPPASGDFAGKPGYVEVIIQHRYPQTFSSVFSSGPQYITGRAVAAGTFGASKASVLVLDPKKKSAVHIKGASLKLAGDLVVNSKSKQSMKVDKKGQIEADNILLAGGIDRKQRNNVSLSGELTTGVDATPNPLAGLPVPPDTVQRKFDDFLTTTGGQRHYNLPPGDYSGKKEFRDDDVVTFQPGTFKFEDEVKFRGNTTVTGHNVTLYMEGKKSFKFETKGSVNLTPPSSGTYSGITLFMDPSSKGKIYFKRDADLAVSGTIYAPNGEVKFQHVDADLGFVESSYDDDDESEEEDSYDSPDWLPDASGSIQAQLIARKLKIDKHSKVEILGAGIDVMAPVLGLVE